MNSDSENSVVPSVPPPGAANPTPYDMRDAKRYQWLRAALERGDVMSEVHEAFHLGVAAALDYAIDEALMEEWMK